VRLLSSKHLNSNPDLDLDLDPDASPTPRVDAAGNGRL
jgi:hypothetical protein